MNRLSCEGIHRAWVDSSHKGQVMWSLDGLRSLTAINCNIALFFFHFCAGLILDLYPANERHRYKVTPSLIGWAQTYNHPCFVYSVVDFYSSRSLGWQCYAYSCVGAADFCETYWFFLCSVLIDKLHDHTNIQIHVKYNWGQSKLE